MADKKQLPLNFDSEDQKINFQYICQTKHRKSMTAVIMEYIREEIKRAGIKITTKKRS